MGEREGGREGRTTTLSNSKYGMAVLTRVVLTPIANVGLEATAVGHGAVSAALLPSHAVVGKSTSVVATRDARTVAANCASAPLQHALRTNATRSATARANTVVVLSIVGRCRPL